MDINNQTDQELHNRFPIGFFSYKKIISQEEEKQLIEVIGNFPNLLRKKVDEMTMIDPKKNWLFYRYRKGGWNIGQVIHHCADSHMNAFLRGKLALTEDNPTIKPYLEDRWANTYDVQVGVVDIDYSIKIVEGLHARWKIFFSHVLTDSKHFEKTFFHPEMNTKVNLKYLLQLYAWHSLHHLAHIELAFATPVQ